LCNVVSSQMLRQELVCGNWFQLLGTALGWCVTPLYKRFADPDLHSHNVLYDLLAPLLRGWFVELSHQRYELRSILMMIAMQRRGAVVCEAAFTLLQILLYRQSAALLAVTVVGVFVNAIPRQFYAQLKMLMRSLHLSFLAAFSDRLVSFIPDKTAAYGGRPVFNESGAEAAEQYLAMQGSHHGGCWQVVVAEAVDVTFSFLGGALMVYLLLMAAWETGGLLGWLETDHLDQYFPFWAVTVTRAAKTLCNFVTTENLLRTAQARQTQTELYFFQRAHLLSQLYPQGDDFIKVIGTAVEGCPRRAFLFVGTPCLAHQQAHDFTIGPLTMFSFLQDPSLQVQKYVNMLKDVMQIPWKRGDTNVLTTLHRIPPPFESQEEMDRVRGYMVRLVWSLFDVAGPDHITCVTSDHALSCLQHCHASAPAQHADQVPSNI